MTTQKSKTLSGMLLNEQAAFTMTEFCDMCAVDTKLVIELVDEGVLDPEGAAPRDWRFSGRMLVRAQRALRLNRDLSVNWPGAALALDLLEELERIRQLKK